jgi:hypothetical protein
VNEYDQAIIPRAQSMLRQGEVLLHMGVARNDANLAGQVALAAAVGMRIVPDMFYLVTTNQRLLAFKCKGYRFNGSPEPTPQDVTALEYGQARINRTGTTALGGQDLFFGTPQGEIRFSIVRSLSATNGSGPTPQGQFFNGYPTWIQQQFATGFAGVGQTPTLEQVFQQIGAMKQQAAAQAAYQASRKPHPRRKTLGALSWVVALLMLPALGALLYFGVEYNRTSGFMYDVGRPGYMVEMKERDLAEIRAGTKQPYSWETRDSAISRLTREIAKEKEEKASEDARSQAMHDDATIGLGGSGGAAFLLLAVLIVLRIMASKVPRFADEDPKLAAAGPMQGGPMQGGPMQGGSMQGGPMQGGPMQGG